MVTPHMETRHMEIRLIMIPQTGGKKMVEVYPFTRLSYRSREIEEKWEPLRRRIIGAVEYAEFQSVVQGKRRADVYQLDPSRFDQQINRATLAGLHFLSILRSKQYGGFGHRHYVSDTIDEDTFIYGVVAATLEDAIRFHDAGVTDLSKREQQWFDMNPNGIDHDITGTLLGYPKCDRDFFRDVWLRDGNLDPEYEIALGTKNVEVADGVAKVSGNPVLNRLLRYWGFQIIPFFSHSFDCEEATKFASWWIEIMRQYDDEAVTSCLELLSLPMRWSVSNCIIYVDHPLFIGAANGYLSKEKKVVEWLPAY